MKTKIVCLVCALLIALPVGIVGFLQDAAAWNISLKSCTTNDLDRDGLDDYPNDPTRCSFHPTIDLGTGGPQTTDTQLLFLLEVLEIGGFCKQNPGSQAETAKGKPFGLHGFSVKSQNVNDVTKTKNGHIVADLPTRTVDLQRIFDISQKLNGTAPPFINLTLTPQGCPNPKWTFTGYEVTKANAQAVFVKVPSFTTKDLGQSGKTEVLDSGFAEFLTTGCQKILVPDLDTNKDGKLDHQDTGLYVIENGSIKMVEVEVCDFLKSPMTYCSRLAGTIGPDGKEADSGLRIHWYDDLRSEHRGEEVPLGDDTFNVRECQLWRDVNKLSAYDLSTIGGTQYLYNPDTDRTHYVSPQTGSADAGGLALSIAPYVWWTGECHQHGSDGGNDGDANYSWVQVGPDKQHLVNGVLTADWICQGGSQLMDGVYNDGILP